jgi:membrane-bound inhibitor of C-type lysozyme
MSANRGAVASRIRVCVLLAAAVAYGCVDPGAKEREEAARNTLACEYAGERLVIRIIEGEVRLLLADGTRVALYQIPSMPASGSRYSNGFMELRGKGTDLEIIRDGVSTLLVGCAPYTPPK